MFWALSVVQYPFFKSLIPFLSQRWFIDCLEETIHEENGAKRREKVSLIIIKKNLKTSSALFQRRHTKNICKFCLYYKEHNGFKIKSVRLLASAIICSQNTETSAWLQLVSSFPSFWSKDILFAAISFLSSNNKQFGIRLAIIKLSTNLNKYSVVYFLLFIEHEHEHEHEHELLFRLDGCVEREYGGGGVAGGGAGAPPWLRLLPWHRVEYSGKVDRGICTQWL